MIGIMNATEMIPKNPSRLRRIKIASRIFRVLILVSLILPILFALLVIFMAWVMDEGRKIQEEQELTV